MNKKNNKKVWLCFFIGIATIILLLGGTLAWYLWQSNNDAVVKASVCAPEIVFQGGTTINGKDLIPVYDKEQGLKKVIDINLNNTCDNDTAVLNLYLEPTLLPDGLKDESFVYELYKEGEDTPISTNNFRDMTLNSDGVYEIATDEIIIENVSTYILYIYLDADLDNPISTQNQNFMFNIYGTGTGAIYRENVIKNSAYEKSSEVPSYFFIEGLPRNSIETIDIVNSSIAPSNATDISSNNDGSVLIWYEDTDSNNLYEVHIGTSNGILTLNTNATYMFYNLTNLANIDLLHVDTSNTTNVKNMFCNCSSLAALDLSNFVTSNIKNMKSIFSDCSSLTELDLNNFNTSNVENMYGMFGRCNQLTNINLSSFNTPKVEDMSYMFYNCSSLVNLDLSNFNTSNVTTMRSMFHGCSGLTSLDLSSFNTSNVTTMSYMFYGCSGLTELDLNNFNTSNVENMYGMFAECNQLTNINLSSFNTPKVEDMSYMFCNCRSLANLDLSSFNTSNVENMSYMFGRCSNLINLNISNFTSEKLSDTQWMFDGCNSLNYLDMRSFELSKVSSYARMFTSGQPSACEIIVKNNTEKNWMNSNFSRFTNVIDATTL